MSRHADRARHQGLDLGPRAALPRVRVRRRRRRRSRSWPAAIRDNAAALGGRAGRARRAATRPAPDVWSPLEYACHVRDVHRVFAERRAPDARARTSRASPTGTRTRPPSRSGYAARTPRSSAPSWSPRRPRRWPSATPRSPADAWAPPRAPAATAASSPSRPSAATTCTTWSTTSTTSRGTRRAPRGRTDEAHRVLGAAGARARAGVRPVLGRAVRDGRARRPHRPAGAGRRRAAQGGVGRGVADPRAPAERASDARAAPVAPTSTSRRSSAAPCARWWPPRRWARVGITIGIATASLLARDLSGSEKLRPGWRRPSRCSARRSRRSCWPG